MGSTNTGGKRVPFTVTGKGKFDIGAWVTYRSVYDPDAEGRKVTVVGHDRQGWALYAEGWIDVRATNPANLIIEN